MSQPEALLGKDRGLVWVVDDSRLETERACSLLGEYYEARGFLDGAAMLESLSEERAPDLILLDWQMPGVSGLEVCRFLRERYDELSLPVLMLTGRGAKRDFTEGLSAGANDYVAKPYDDAELLARVRTLVRMRQQARAMRVREEWFATTLRSIGDAVVATEEDGTVTFLNQVAEQLTGWESSEALGRPIDQVLEIIDESTGMSAKGVLERALREPGASQVVGRAMLVRRDGSRLPIDDSVAPIGLQARQGAVVVFRDASERQRAAAETARRVDFEEKLIGIVSHDLRNPLNVINLGAQALLHAGADDRFSRTARRIKTSAERATRLVNDLLDFTQARLGNGIPVKRMPVDLQSLVVQVLDDARAAHPQRTLEQASLGDTQGQWDADRLAQALLNLISNAFAYGESDGAVTVRTVGEDEWVTLEVHNRGAPISKQVLPVLFEPMRRGNEPTAAVERSVGLGLYIVKHIVDAHGGSISVQSSTETGTTFALRLPRSA
jgi:PAS domain S-box-containing protein